MVYIRYVTSYMGHEISWTTESGIILLIANLYSIIGWCFRSLRYTDQCVTESTFRCVGGLARSVLARFSVERQLAVDICGGLDEEAFIPKCRVKSKDYADVCSKKSAEKCVRKFIRNVGAWPVLQRGRQCA